ncbi:MULTISPECIES: MFS transporter [Priestia]|jgi:MFS family permease|uniref:MFS transporter n=1 Tax=Priestia TaxID=2800373 RepID=UPI00040504C5|nr:MULTISPECIES: MFS transporter [Priestia]RFB40078.1 MFS transporter [Bacillus sp. RC]ANF45479.1 sugar transporter [Priestia megaterium]AQU73151.1 MFS transporter [Priestia megaterium]MBV6736087.1 MFS transporter [Priestia megaterium]MCA4156222.1 MFS transporter [Priestia megaterium]
MSKTENSFVSGIKIVFTDRDFLTIFISLFIIGLSVGGFMPYLTVWATNTLHATSFQAGFLFVPMSIIGLIVSFYLASLSDKWGKRKPFIIWALLIGTISRVPLAFTHSYTIALILLAIGGFNAFSFFFALLNDFIVKKQESKSQAGTITGTVRMAFSQGYIFGPMLGALIIDHGGYTLLFLLSGLLSLATLGWVLFALKEDSMPQTSAHASSKAPAGIPSVLIAVFVAALFIFAGDSGRSMYLPLYITNTLKQSVSIVGILFTVTSVFELVFMPLGGYFSDKIGVKRFFIIGIACQVLYFILTSLHLPLSGLIVLQVFYAFILSATMGVGMVYAQSLAPRQIGLATTAYMTAIQTSAVVSSLAMGSLVSVIPLPSTFYILAVFAVISGVMFLFMKQKSAEEMS